MAMGSFGSVSEIPGGIEITQEAAAGNKGEVSLVTVNPQTGTYIPIPLDDGRTLHFNKATGVAYFSDPGGAKTYFENVWLQPYELQNCEKDDADSCASVTVLPVAAYQNSMGTTGEFTTSTAYGDDQSYNRIRYNVIMGDTQDLAAQTISQTALAKFAGKLNGMTSAEMTIELNLINDPLVLMQLLNVDSDPPLNEAAREAIRARLKTIKEKKRQRQQKGPAGDKNSEKAREMGKKDLLLDRKRTSPDDAEAEQPGGAEIFGESDNSDDNGSR